jgi:HemK-like putative methylase
MIESDNQPKIWHIKRSQELISRLRRGESPPDLARIKIGDLQLEISKGATMVPSPETYRHAKSIGNALRRIIMDSEVPLSVVDVGTGTGIIALSLAKDLQKEMSDEEISIVATDISLKALCNAQNNACSNEVRGITFVQGDGLRPFKNETVDVVISNPPFMKSSILGTSTLFSTFIPPEAVVAGETGMDFYRKLFIEAQQVLSPRGVLIVQHQDFDREALTQIIHDCFGTSIPIGEMYGNRQTALAIGNPAWVDIICGTK